MLGRVLLKVDQIPEAVTLLEHALAIQERVHGPVHPRVASALNELAWVDGERQEYAKAEARFRRMIEIYRSVYSGEHYLQATALGNLASMIGRQDDFVRAERLMRQAVGIFERTQGPTHVNTGIGRVKLGRTLLRQKRYADAERETRAGYDILKGQVDPSMSFLVSARTDLAEAYDGLGQSDQAATMRAEIEAVAKAHAQELAQK